MRSAPNNYENTLIKIQNEINEVARRESELRELHQTAGFQKQHSLNGDSTTRVIKNDEVRVLQRAVSTSSLATNSSNGIQRRFIPNSKGVMQKFFKLRGRVSAINAIGNSQPNLTPETKPTAWSNNNDVSVAPPVKALIPTDKPLRKGYVPVEARILSELREMENREQELKTERRRSQPNLLASLENSDDDLELSRTPSPAFLNKLKPARSLSQLLDEDLSSSYQSDASQTLKPARSLAQLCDVPDDDIVSSKSLIKQWESRIQESQREA